MSLRPWPETRGLGKDLEKSDHRRVDLGRSLLLGPVAALGQHHGVAKLSGEGLQRSPAMYSAGTAAALRAALGDIRRTREAQRPRLASPASCRRRVLAAHAAGIRQADDDAQPRLGARDLD